MTEMRRDLVIVGGGMAAGRLLQRLVALGYARSITLISAEPALPYNRVLLPDLLSGQCIDADLTLQNSAWYERHGIRFLGNRTVTRIDLDGRHLSCSDGSICAYEQLVLATGATVPKPELPNVGLPGTTVLRNLAQAHALRCRGEGDVCVVGGGLLGLETARSLAATGARVHVVHRANRLLNRQLDGTGAELVRAFLETHSIECALGETVTAIHGSESVRAVELTSGRQIPVRTLVFATGTTPDDSVARQSGLATDRGVLTSAALATSDPAVFAIGECARVDGTAHALVEPVFRQADVLADRLCGGSSLFAAPTAATRLKVAGLDVFSAGIMTEAAGPDDIVIHDPARRIYRRFHYRQDVLAGAVLIGDSSGSRAVQQCLETGGRPADPLGLAFGNPGVAA